MARIIKKLRGSTLVEGIVAMVIILTCATIAFTALAKHEHGINNALRTEAEMNILYVVSQAKQSGKLFDSTVDFENMQISVQIENYKEYKGLKLLVCEAYTLQSELICDYKEIIKYEKPE